MTNLEFKKLIIFDLDGTLAPSKSSIDEEMHILLERLLEMKKVLVISGGRWSQFKYQLLDHLHLTPEGLSNLFLSIGGGSSMYRFTGGEIHEMYADILNKDEKEKIYKAYEYALPAFGFVPHEHNHGKLIEDRQSEITFSALGQEAPLEEKKLWDPDHKKRIEIMKYLKEKIPEFEIRSGGTTSIDITKKNKDKAYGVEQASERLGISIEKILFVGDALYPEGNDYPATKTGVECIAVSDPEETKKLIKGWIETTT